MFPNIKGKTVNGHERTLPHDFTGRYNIVLLAFTQEQQYEVNTWMTFLMRLRQTNPEVNVYEVPVVKRYSFVQRRLLDYWMYSGIPDADTRDRTITLYTDVGAFLDTLGLPNAATIYMLVVDRDGLVSWQTTGSYDERKAAELINKLNLLKGQPA